MIKHKEIIEIILFHIVCLCEKVLPINLYFAKAISMLLCGKK